MTDIADRDAAVAWLHEQGLEPADAEVVDVLRSMMFSCLAVVALADQADGADTLAFDRIVDACADTAAAAVLNTKASAIERARGLVVTTRPPGSDRALQSPSWRRGWDACSAAIAARMEGLS